VNLHSTLEQSDDFARFEEFFEFLQIESTRASIQKVLDYGCGADAKVLRKCLQLGFSSAGVELDEATREAATFVSNAKVYSPESLFSSTDEFDLIFLGDVVEHLTSPMDLLTEIRKLLSKEGKVFVQGPLEGARTLSHLILQVKAAFMQNDPSTQPPYHVSLANFHSIRALLESSGFEIVSLKVVEIQWPAPVFLSSDSFRTLSSFVFSFTKLFDVVLGKILPNYGTRFYCVAKTGQLQNY
jgi:SAM-dependent methyltransferase